MTRRLMSYVQWVSVGPSLHPRGLVSDACMERHLAGEPRGWGQTTRIDGFGGLRAGGSASCMRLPAPPAAAYAVGRIRQCHCFVRLQRRPPGCRHSKQQPCTAPYARFDMPAASHLSYQASGHLNRLY